MKGTSRLYTLKEYNHCLTVSIGSGDKCYTDTPQDGDKKKKPSTTRAAKDCRPDRFNLPSWNQMPPKRAIQATLHKDMKLALLGYTGRVPGQNLSKICADAVEVWLKDVEGRSCQLYHPTDGPFIKPEGERFPARLSDDFKKGRPATGRNRTSSGNWSRTKIYLPEELADRFLNAVWWRVKYPAHDLGDALIAYLKETNLISLPSSVH